MSLTGFRSSNHPQQVAKRGATDRDDLGTDPAFFAELDARFGFTLDAAASPATAKCGRFFTSEDNGLERSWTGERVWCNPPYSNIAPWIRKAWDEDGAPLIVMLLPANRTEQGWWQDEVEPDRDCNGGGLLRTEFIRGRKRFVKPGAEAIGPNERPPFGCVLLIWRREYPQTNGGGK